MTSSRDAFLLEHAVDWLGSRLNLLPQPFFGYFHICRRTHRTRHLPSLRSLCGDGLRTIEKRSRISAIPDRGEAVQARRAYDEFLLYVDKAFANLYESLENGDTWRTPGWW